MNIMIIGLESHFHIFDSVVIQSERQITMKIGCSNLSMLLTNIGIDDFPNYM